MAVAERSRSVSHSIRTTDLRWHGIRIKYYYSPMFQTAVVGFFAFATVGMSSALGGAGGGGLLNTYQSTNANVAVYSTFAALAFFAGTLYNRLGVRMSLMFGGFGYALLAGAYFCTKHIGNKATAFIIVAGCVEGLCAAMLWTGQGAVTMAYPTEDEKGKAFTVFWVIFQLGAVIGSIIPICMNWNSKAGSLSDGTYIAFIVIMLVGCLVPLLLVPSDRVVRKDGTRVVLPAMPTWRSEIEGLLKVLIADKWIVTLFPFFIASNWFYTYQKNDFNAPNFTIRTRSFNGLVTALFNMIGVWLIGFVLDFRPNAVSRRIRARLGLAFILVATMAIWGGGWVFVKDSKRGVVPKPLIDVTESSRFAPHVMIYIFWGLYDGLYQGYAYWLMGAMSNSSQKLAHYSGWYKSLQSAGAAVVWRLDGLEVSYRSMYLSTWMILVGSLLAAGYVAFCRVTEHTEDEVQVIEAVWPGLEGEASGMALPTGTDRKVPRVSSSLADDKV